MPNSNTTQPFEWSEIQNTFTEGPLDYLPVKALQRRKGKGKVPTNHYNMVVARLKSTAGKLHAAFHRIAELELIAARREVTISAMSEAQEETVAFIRAEQSIHMKAQAEQIVRLKAELFDLQAQMGYPDEDEEDDRFSGI